MVTLQNGVTIAVPDLTDEILEVIFKTHAAFLDDATDLARGTPLHMLQMESHQAPAEGEGNPAFRLAFDNLETMNSVMHHNSAQAHIPDLPKEIISKIAAIAKVVAPTDLQNMPKPEPHCNCMHCQIARAIHQSTADENEPHEAEKANVHEEGVEDPISVDELSFQQWEIVQTGDKLYAVTNRIDTLEKYSVYLGNPVGCTCGKAGCEHILAVLKS